MDNHHKTREELIEELQELRKEYDTYKAKIEEDLICRNQVKEEQRESQERFKQLFNQAPLGYQSLDFDGHFIDVNQQWLDTLGYERDEVIGKWFGDFLSPDYQDGFRKRFPVFKEQGYIHSEFEMVHKNGRILFIAFDGRIGYDEHGKFKQTHCILQDITESKHTEMKLIASDERFNLAMKASSDGLFDWNLETNEIYYAPAWKKMLGYEDDEIQNDFSVWENATEPEDVKKSWELQQKLISKQIERFVLEFKMKHKDGHWVDILSRAEAIFNDNGKAIRIVGTHTDITERKQAEEALKNRESLLNKVFDVLPIGLWFADEKGRLIRGNPAGVKIWGAEPTVPIEEYGIFKARRLPSGKEIEFDDWALAHTIREGVTIDNELLEIDAFDGHKKIILNFTAPVMDDRGNIQGAIVVNQDITEQRQAEQKLKESELKYRSLVENTNDVVFCVDEKGEYKFTNNVFANTFGKTPDYFIGKTFWDVYPKKEADHRFMAVKEMFRTGEVQTIEVSVPLPDKTLYFLAKANPIKDESGKVILNLTTATDITERKLAEEKLRKSEERYSLVIDASEQGIWDWNVETNEVFYSEKWKKQIGYEDHELKNEFNTWVDHLHPDEREYCENAVSAYLHHPVKHFILDFRFRHKDGTYRWIHSKAASLKDKDGKVIRLFGVHTDITESKLSESIFKDIIEKNPFSIQILDMEGYPIQVNPAHTKLFGVEPPSNYSVLKDAQLLSLGFEEFFERIKKGEIINFPDSYYNVHDVDPSFPDSPIWVKAVGFTLSDNYGNPDRIVLMHENITERKNAEALLNDIIDKNPLSIQIVDKEGFTLNVNPAFMELWGSIPPSGFSIFDDLKSKSPEMEDLILRVKNGEVVHLPDIYFNAHDEVAEAPDIPLWIRAIIFPLNDSGGKSERFAIMHENITYRKTAEEELIRAKEHAEESDRLKSAFLANMSHEIRTPMNGILGFANLLKTPNLSGEEQQKYIQIIDKSGKRMLNIINDIVDFSKIEAGLMELKIEESNINEQVEYIYNFFKPEVEANGMTLSFRNYLPAKEAIILTDREKVYAILTNLVKNAIKYSKKGDIIIGYEAVELPGKSTELKFYIQDSGIGIPKDRLEAIFERFIQADITDKMVNQGAGLGLSITKAYVEMLGGKIWVESEEGIGSTFYFTLPYNAETIIEEDDSQIVTSNDLDISKKLKILIAEDDEISEMLIEVNINHFCSEVFKAKTGTETVEICRNNPDIDLILMDILMPGLNGYEATRQIRQFNKEVVIIAQTAYGLSNDRDKALEAGCNDYITKPIDNDLLNALIQKYCGK